ncbi:MAG TPA: hypothetical protein VL181_01805 [Holophagaceae bacterium]|nr:hypothetical protein [Holophagaceae bacterium]
MDAILNTEDAETARKARNKACFRAVRLVYLTYLVAVLIGWELTWHMSVPGQIGWWFSAWQWLAVPTLPGCFLGVRLWGMGPQSLAVWMNVHPHLSIVVLWALVSALGYAQWFIAVPWVWMRLRMMAGPRTSSMIE